MSREAHSVVHDVLGDPIEVWADNGSVWLLMPSGLASLDPEQQEHLGQAYIAACNAADRQQREIREAASHA